jgi:hypothetical protein
MKAILTLLFIPFALSAQKYVTDGEGNRVFINGDAVKSVGVPVYPGPAPGTTGEGQVVWFNDIELLTPTNNMVSAHVDTIFGTTSLSNGFSRGANVCEIIEEDGNNFMRFRMTQGVGGGANNVQIIKSITGVLGTYDELWCVAHLRFDSNMADTLSGKMPLGFRGGDEDWWGDLPYIEGFNFRKSYNKSQNHRGQLYYADMTTSSGNSSNGWKYTWPTGSDAYIEDEWYHFAIRHVMDPNPPDSADSFFEYYIDGNLAGRWDNTKTRTADSIHIDEFLCAWFPNNSYEPPIATIVDVDNIGLIIFTDGDSTLTGAERSPDFNVVRFPGHPMGTDTTGWGTFD